MKKVTVIVGLLVLGIAAYQVRFWQRIYPKVQIAGILVGDMEIEEAQAYLSPKLQVPTLTLTWGTSRWQIATNDFDLQYDSKASVIKAFALGRSQSALKNLLTQATLFTSGATVTPSFSVDENKIVQTLAPIETQINIPVKEPDIQIVDNAIVVSAGDNGQAVDERLLLQRIKQNLAAANSSSIEIPVRKIEPKLSDAQVQNLQVAAGKLIGKKITLTLDSQTWDITGNQIVSWIDPSAGSGQVLSWKKAEIGDWISELAQNIDRPAANARFRYSGSGKVEEFSPAQEGLAVSQSELVNAVVAILGNDQKTATVTIPVVKTTAEIQTSQVNNLGIKELVARGESDYSGSIPNRIFNVHKAAQSMNGVLVAPGEEFSFDKYVGDISAADGYKQAYVIKQGRTVLGDGGGVCQVSTTMFRAALNAGLPITARTAHAYRVHYYENGSQPGFDATIFTPSVDFRFKNDTSAYLLIQTSFDEAQNKLFFDLYGTKDNREVVLSKARVWDVAPPPPALYQDDPTLQTGVVQQVDFPAWGAKAAFDYKVTRDGQVLEQQTFYSNYAPWQAVYLRGTKV